MSDLQENCVYKLTSNKTGKQEEAVFLHVGKTGKLVFHPVGEQSFQDWFMLQNPADWQFEFLRNKE